MSWSPGELDLHLVAEGRHERLWEVLGAHRREVDGVVGTTFAVWAPNAREVRVVGGFSHWSEVGGHRLAPVGAGVWAGFVPELHVGEHYKYAIRTPDDRWQQRADPLARWTEVPPATASRIAESAYVWGDDDWLAARTASDPRTRRLSVYELHLGSWRPGATYRSVADELIAHVTALGFTHVEFLPLAEHPYGGSWGYQVTGYYAPTSRFGEPDDLRHLIDRLHQAGIGVLLDWVPAHFPKDEFALARFDGTPLYEHPDPRRGEHPDWGTLIPDYSRPEVRNFLVANALYWLEEFHVDGLRVDAVASMLYLDYSRDEGEWLPNAHGGREHLEAVAFLQELTATAQRVHPGVLLIAEESTAWPGVTAPTTAGGLGFDLKWNMGWMHDSLEYLREDPLHRGAHHGRMTGTLGYAFGERYLLPLSHDEVVHGKGSLLSRMPGTRAQQFASLRAYLAWMWSHPGRQLLFMGGEFAQSGEWREEHGLDWWLLEHEPHRGMQMLVGELNRVQAAHPALWERDDDPAGVEWLEAADPEHSVIAIVRWSHDGRPVVVVSNFAGIAHDYRLALPSAGRWLEVLNTDAREFGGDGGGNLGVVRAEPVAHRGRPASAFVHLPPLTTIWLAPEAPASPA